ncbi:hypothetical protein C2S53_002573 [Perilla frutescens var. hirtella]|uniref:Uncharacterized protein n=1 Tax=Perilla frutescens var. hirtella TaxID=608512 RepID=A0AAD4IRW5_PERFH|nr:hypothetical protein C2S53_002573 [Perilla frutescens var. hirtella]
MADNYLFVRPSCPSSLFGQRLVGIFLGFRRGGRRYSSDGVRAAFGYSSGDSTLGWR